MTNKQKRIHLALHNGIKTTAKKCGKSWMVGGDFDWKVIDGVLVIYDKNLGNMSVTNGMEEVLYQIKHHLGRLPKLIIYRDSEGIFDQTFLEEGVARFHRIGVKSAQEAITIIKGK